MSSASSTRKAEWLSLAFWTAAALLLTGRLLLGSDLSVQIAYMPHDDSMYAERAFHLLNSDGFGPYDSRILVKYPSVSLWLALVRSLGIPFLLSVNLIYIAAGAYLLVGLRRAGVKPLILLGALALHLFNPITYGTEWIRVLREPLGTGLFIAMAGAVLHMLLAARHASMPWRHLAVFAPVFAFSLYLREDDRLLWGLLVLAAVSFAIAVRARVMGRNEKAFLVAMVVVPVVLALTYQTWLRSFVEERYGVSIIHELGEGEFPKLLAAIRSVQSKKDNRLVMVTQEALAKLRVEVPMLAPVIDRLPPPGPMTLSCTIQGVCSEWSNGWMPFWIKDAAFSAGLTPNAQAAQDYFRRARAEIERACDAKRLQCLRKGDGLLPPFELRWSRALVAEAWRLAKMAIAPSPHAVGSLPVIYAIPVDLGRIVQAVTMSSYFDTQRQISPIRLPSSRSYESPLAALRLSLVLPYQLLTGALILLALAALALRLWRSDRVPLGPVAEMAAVFGIYLLVRSAALSYVAVYMGPFDPRMMFSAYALAAVMALPVVADFRSTRGARERAKKR